MTPQRKSRALMHVMTEKVNSPVASLFMTKNVYRNPFHSWSVKFCNVYLAETAFSIAFDVLPNWTTFDNLLYPLNSVNSVFNYKYSTTQRTSSKITNFTNMKHCNKFEWFFFLISKLRKLCLVICFKTSGVLN